MSEEVTGPIYNVFEALDLPEPDVLQAKNLARRALREALEARGLSQRAAAKLMGVSQPNLARALAGTSESVTFDQLFKLWTALGGRVQIGFVAGEPNGRGQIVAESPGQWMVPLEAATAPAKPRRKSGRDAAAERVQTMTAGAPKRRKG